MKALNCEDVIKEIVRIEKNYKQIWRTLKKDEIMPVIGSGYVEKLTKIKRGLVEIFYTKEPGCVEAKLEDIGFRHGLKKIKKNVYMQVDVIGNATKVYLIRYSEIRHVKVPAKLQRSQNPKEVSKTLEEIIKKYGYNELLIASKIQVKKMRGKIKMMWVPTPVYVVLYNVSKILSIDITDVPQLILDLA